MARKKMTKAQRTRQIYIRCGLLLLLLIAVFVTVFVLINRLSKTEINLNKNTHFTMTGFNGEGEIAATVDVESGYEAFFETVKVEFSKSSGLSNGDEIDITYTYDTKIAKAYNLRVVAQKQHIAVKGLVEPTQLSKEDIFEGVNVVYEGIAPLVTASVDVENKFNGCITYEVVDAKEYYNVGDLIKVRAFYDAAKLADMDYVAELSSENCVKEFTVADVDRYVLSTDDITDDMMASLKKEALSFYTEATANEYGMRIFCDAGLMPVYVDKKTTFSWSTPGFVSSYLSVLKEENYGKTGTDANQIKLCYESVISQADGQACKAEVVVQFSNIIIRRDGTVELNLESGAIISADRRDSHIKAIVQNQIDDDYESVKI